MNADGQRFHLLLGKADWGRCASRDGVSLETVWDGATGSPPASPADAAPGWDENANDLTLAPRLVALPPTKGDIALEPALRHGAAADTFGNVYWIGDDATQLFVQSRGDGAISRFWPDPRAARPTKLFFDACESAPAVLPYRALAVTNDGWLVAATATGLDSFDLVAGGPPLHFDWPAGTDPVIDLETRRGGGLWLLDAKGVLFELDPTLTLTTGTEPPAPDLFQPVSGETRQHAGALPATGHGLSGLAPGIKPIAIAPLPDGRIAVLSRNPDLLCLWTPDNAETAAPITLDFTPHDLVAADVMLRGGKTALRVLVSGGTGNQVRAYTYQAAPLPRLVALAEAYPLRRYGGRALVSIEGNAAYDSGPAPQWTRIVEKPRQQYAPQATFVTPRFDSNLPGAVWDRLRLDGCIPPGSRVTIMARAGDDPAALGDWHAQPSPLLSKSGSELAAHASAALVATDPIAQHGTFELLFQRIEGQYLEVQLSLASDGDASPHLRALRVSWPRVSWAQRYLPALYREDPEPADFLERFLANMQGTVSGIENRMITAQALFDPRTVPAEALGWLAEWFDVALDPAWTEPVSRAFIANAIRFFGWRGTMKGLESALALAFGQPLDGTLFGSGDCSCESPIRIVETYRTRTLGRIGAGDPSGGAPDPAYDAGLEERDRWIAFQTMRGRSATQRLGQLPRQAVPAAHAGDWAAFMALRGHNREAWQRFLEGRYRRIDMANRAHGSRWAGFGEIALCDAEPATAAARADWAAFQQVLLPIDRAAHRFSVLLPVGANDATDSATLETRRKLATRIVNLEKPAHTIFDIRFYFAMNRIGEARLGIDTAIGDGSRSADTMPLAILGRAYLGESFMGPDGLPLTPDRARLAC